MSFGLNIPVFGFRHVTVPIYKLLSFIRYNSKAFLIVKNVRSISKTICTQLVKFS